MPQNICQANRHTMLWEFMSIISTEYHMPFYSGIRDLTNDISVGYMDDHSLFGCVVLNFCPGVPSVSEHSNPFYPLVFF